MRHPSNRAERRHERGRVIARRKFVYLRIWFMEETSAYFDIEPFSEWGRYDKFNGNCNSKLCHAAKYFEHVDKRRKALKAAESQAEFRKKDKVAGKK